MRPEIGRIFSTQFTLSPTRRASVAARTMLAGAWGICCTLILAAPILRSHSFGNAASVLYLSFSRICHQIPDRSFFFCGHPLAVCQRCSGIYFGLFLGSLIGNRFMHRSPQTRRLWILAACIPMSFDVFLSYSGLWHGAGPVRFFTGLWFGGLLSTLLVRGLTELWMEACQRRRSSAGDSPFKKGYSWIQKEC